MEEEILNSEYSYSQFSISDKIIYLKSNSENSDEIAIRLSISLQGVRRGVLKTVNTEYSLDDYLYGCFINPYLTAQNDFFKLKFRSGNDYITIGYIFPNSSLEDDIENLEDDFDEAKQAYKFYAIRKIIENHIWKSKVEEKEITLSQISNSNHSHLIIYKPLLKGRSISIEELLPSLALYGYYNFSYNAIPNILKIGEIAKKNQDFAEIVKNHFTFLRGRESLSIRSSLSIYDRIPLIKIVYQQILIEADNPLYRFLILYQIVEYLVDKSFRDSLEELVKNRDSINGYDFITKINEIKKTRGIINNLFSSISFPEKESITTVLKNFLLEFNNSYESISTGDCLYDVRNLFFHDYKNVLQSKKTDNVIGLIVLCEILIHKLVIHYASEIDEEIKNSEDKMPLAWLCYQALQD